MTIKKNLVVANGSYEVRGERKTRWLTIGHVHEGSKGHYITLEAYVNLAALERKDGDSRVYVNLFEPRDSTQGRDSGRDSHHSQPREDVGSGDMSEGTRMATDHAFDDDDIPF